MLWLTSPAATELELRTVDWLRQLMGLGDGWFGEITDTASVSTLYALAAAREAAGLDIRAQGMAGRADMPALRVYCSAHAHSSVDKAAITLGLGHENVVKIPVDASYRMRPEALRAQPSQQDVAAGYRPLAVVATVGTTSTSSVDDVSAIVPIARAFGCWVHVDARVRRPGGDRARAALAARRGGRRRLAGGQPAQVAVHAGGLLGAVHQAAGGAASSAFSLVAEYLRTPDDDTVVNLMDYGVQLGRRFRSLKLWMVLRAFGADGIAERLRHHCELAREFAGMLHYEGDWEICAPVPLSLVCFRYAPAGTDEAARNALNAAILEHVNASGVALLSHTKLEDRYVLRLAIGSVRTQREHIDATWQAIRAAAQAVTAAASTRVPAAG